MAEPAPPLLCAVHGASQGQAELSHAGVGGAVVFCSGICVVFFFPCGESHSKDEGNAWKEAQLRMKPRQSLRILFGLLGLAAHEASFTCGLDQLRESVYVLC